MEHQVEKESSFAFGESQNATDLYGLIGRKVRFVTKDMSDHRGMYAENLRKAFELSPLPFKLALQQLNEELLIVRVLP